jgi:uncharacterized protein (TIGR03086 family)
VAGLSRERQLIESAVGYALAGAGIATPGHLPCPTPCPGWDLGMLLDHLSDSIGALHEVIAAGARGTGAAPPGDLGPWPAPVARLRGQAARLLDACDAWPAGRRVAIGDRELTARIVAVTASIEIAVHGWDIWVSCSACRPVPPVPPGLAAILLPIAPLLITPATRPGLFAGLVELPGSARPGDQLIAFLGRQPQVVGAELAGSGSDAVRSRSSPVKRG